MTSRDTDRLLFLQAARRELLRLRKLFYRVFMSQRTAAMGSDPAYGRERMGQRHEAYDLLVGIQRGLRMTRDLISPLDAPLGSSRASIQRELDHAYPAVAEAMMYNGGRRGGYLYNGRWNPPLGPGL